ncbi:MAG TPA: J domain-containing protein [Gammaproteobacteria bacterium]|nr:J domain-containing protein [Gammaproteobacteria bacterium]
MKARNPISYRGVHVDPSYYEVLRVPSDADESAIKKAFRNLAMNERMHPDKGGDPEKFKLISRAYEVLLSINTAYIKREEYDQILREYRENPEIQLPLVLDELKNFSEVVYRKFIDASNQIEPLSVVPDSTQAEVRKSLVDAIDAISDSELKEKIINLYARIYNLKANEIYSLAIGMGDSNKKVIQKKNPQTGQLVWVEVTKTELSNEALQKYEKALLFNKNDSCALLGKFRVKYLQGKYSESTQFYENVQDKVLITQADRTCYQFAIQERAIIQYNLIVGMAAARFFTLKSFQENYENLKKVVLSQEEKNISRRADQVICDSIGQLLETANQLYESALKTDTKQSFEIALIRYQAVLIIDLKNTNAEEMVRQLEYKIENIKNIDAYLEKLKNEIEQKWMSVPGKSIPGTVDQIYKLISQEFSTNNSKREAIAKAIMFGVGAAQHSQKVFGVVSLAQLKRRDPTTQAFYQKFIDGEYANPDGLVRASDLSEVNIKTGNRPDSKQ